MFAHVFADKVTETKEAKPKPMDRKLISTFNSLKYEERKKEQQAQEKKKRPGSHIQWLDDTAKEEMIITEMSKMMDKKKSWKALDVCFKWKIIQDYIQETQKTFSKDNIKHLQSALRQGHLLNVDYSHSERKIHSLNFVVDGITL
jgi:hypothetical protein